jgi:hypothetical protein
MILEKQMHDYDLTKKAYWFKSTKGTLYTITLDYTYSKIDGEINSVKAIALEVDTNYIDDDVDVQSIKNGTEVFLNCDMLDWILELDIWAKYYFPKFNEKKNQWYHQEDFRDVNYIDDFTELLKFTYELAMKVSKLKTY